MAKEEDKQPEEEAVDKSGMGKILILGIGGLLVIGISAGVALYLTGFFDPAPVPDQAAETVGKTGVAKDSSTPAAPAQYLNLQPFTVSLNGNGGHRFLQITVSLMARSEDVLSAVKANKPAVRNTLTLLFSSQSAEALSSREGTLVLQKQAITEIRKILMAEGAPAELEAIYFTNFVID